MNIKFETIRSNKNRILFFGGIVCVVILLVAIVLNVTRAKYRIAQSMPLYNATVNYTPYDFKMVAMYQESDTGEYVSIDTVPSSGYKLNVESSYCEVDNTKDGTITITYEDGSLTFGNVTKKGTKCYVYFDVYIASVKDTLLAYYPTVLTRTSFSSTVTDTTTGTIYKSADSTQYDDDGEVYYFAGNPTDNWVSFAGFYWRIIRVNGDGSILLIYQGTSANTTGTGTQISTSEFNSMRTDNMYVGYMYTSGSVHGLGTNSTIKGVLDTWYSNKLSRYASYIDTNAGFCGDRTPYSGSGTGTNETYYAAYNRLYTNKTPTFSCSNSSDLYTISSSNKGNKALTYPIGLITADEVAYAGGVYRASNSSFYLYTNQDYWTMSPYFFFGNNANVFLVGSSGYFSDNYLIPPYGVRPVINLKADTVISSGNGSSDTPFVVAG